MGQSGVVGRTARLAMVGAFFAGAAAVAFPAAAEDNGWYFGIEGFGSRVKDAENKTHLPDQFTPPVDSDCSIINLLDIVCLLPVPGQPGSFAPGAAVTTHFSFKDSWGGGAHFGYSFEGGFRPEISLAYSSNDIETVRQNDGSVIHPQGASFDAMRAMANGWFDINLGPVAPYLGAGAGFQETKFKSGGSDVSDTTFAYQYGGGIGFALGSDWNLSIDYRYVVADKPTFSGQNDIPVESQYKGQTLGLGLRYNFGPANGTDSDGDGVPDRKDKCPNTPKGVQVYSDGCPMDLDGDGVPDYLDKCPGTPHGLHVNAQGCEFDSDGDGIADSRDQCPGTPRGVRVNPQGCPLDGDGDGVPDYLDKCPGTPKGTRVNELGCALTDADGDGVPDAFDKCPGSPPGIQVGPDGCPKDSDGDGIPDYLDECPHSPPGAKVLPNGCALKGDCRKPRAGEQVDEHGCALEQRFLLRGVKFEFDSDRLLPESKTILNDVAATLQAYPDVKVEVEGHTDNIGTDAYNLGLSERRANAVKTYLAGRGVKGEHMIPVGYGESRPIASNDNEPGREENRRVEFKVAE
jgi:OOP family OmpA-OmpF porin